MSFVRVSFLWLLRQRAVGDLDSCGLRAEASTRLVMMPTSWRTMAPTEDLFRLVLDARCVDPTRGGRLDRAEVGDDRYVWRFRAGAPYWAVVSSAGMVLGRTRPAGMSSGKVVFFASRDDAADFAGFPPRDTNGATRSTEWLR